MDMFPFVTVSGYIYLFCLYNTPTYHSDIKLKPKKHMAQKWEKQYLHFTASDTMRSLVTSKILIHTDF